MENVKWGLLIEDATHVAVTEWLLTGLAWITSSRIGQRTTHVACVGPLRLVVTVTSSPTGRAACRAGSGREIL